jgi:type IV pilus assembly protein PilA
MAAIVGILAAVGIPTYQDYIARTQVARAVAETGSLKPIIDACIAVNRIGISTAGAAPTAAQCSMTDARSSTILTGARIGDAPVLPVTGNSPEGYPAIAGFAAGGTVTITGTFGNGATAVLKASGTGAAAVAAKTVKWTRDATTGVWTCSTTADPKHKPIGCIG